MNRYELTLWITAISSLIAAVAQLLNALNAYA